MRLTFLGAAGEVTGSCYLLETGAARVLIDFGLHQGGEHADDRNRRLPAPIRPEALDAVLVTHAHLDHTGRLPLLPKAGFRGSVWATPATIDLTGILLRDAAYLQRIDAERESREGARHGRAGVSPLYTLEDAEAVLPMIRGVEYGESIEVAPGVTASWAEAGHILGSASIRVRVREPARPGRAAGERTIVFSGDLGPRGAPLLRDAARPEPADVVVLESTYGDRDHRAMGATLEEFAGILAEALGGGGRARGKVIIPAFAVGRTQNLVYHLGLMRRAGRIPDPEVWIDSPMAIETTELYRRHRDLFDAEAWAIINAGDTPLHFPGLRLSRDRASSEALNPREGIVVISASGMCQGGRIVHHLRHNLGNPHTHVVIAGFQARGTTGRALVDGAGQVRIMGQQIEVRARVHTLGGFSAHAGQSDLVWWMGKVGRPRVFLTHGEDGSRAALADTLKERYGVGAGLPGFGEVAEV